MNETTRHFVATLYPVNEGATALHHHERLDLWLPPGGHVDRDELPHVAALGECHEETGLDPVLEAGLDTVLVAPRPDVRGPGARSLLEPHHLLPEDVHVGTDGDVAHRHVDHVYFGRADSRRIEPAGDDEAVPGRWEWFAPAELRRDDRLTPEVIDLSLDAIRTVTG